MTTHSSILAWEISWREEPGAHPTKHARTQLTLEQRRGLSAYMSSKSAVPLHPQIQLIMNCVVLQYLLLKNIFTKVDLGSSNLSCSRINCTNNHSSQYPFYICCQCLNAILCTNLIKRSLIYSHSYYQHNVVQMLLVNGVSTALS